MSNLIKEIQAEVPNQIFCIDAAPSIKSMLTGFSSQLDNACNVTSELASKYNLQNGFIIMGLSQGGLLARGVVEKCEMGQYVKKLITFGGPHQGVAQFPHTGKGFFDNILNEIVDKAVYNRFIQGLIGPAGYFHRIDNEEAYFNSNIVLADLNNVGKTVNVQYSQRMSQLEALVLIMFSEDTMIIPKETAHFGFYKDSKRIEIVALEDSDVVKNDLIGIKALVNEGKVHKHVFTGEHLQMSMTEMRKYVFIYF